MQSTVRGCARCGQALPVGGRGRVPTYCSGRCRVAAHRARTALPAEMTKRETWVRRTERKVPVTTAHRPASVTDPSTWTTYAKARASRVGAGLGFVLDGSGIVCIDLDHCIDGGEVASWAREILDRLPATYIELSPSGTGLHIFGRGHVATGRRIRRGDGSAIEIYGERRYIAVTGDRYGSAPAKLSDLSEVIADLI
jgi:primase-polymerase (primpol)-like protein